MKTAFITGGAGFIGSHLAEKLLNENYKLVILDNLFRGKKENIKKVLENFNNIFFEVDLIESNAIDFTKDLILKYNPSLIVHYAAINGTQYFYDQPEKVAEVNSIATYNLMTALTKAVRINNLIKPLIVFASSSEVYGEPKTLPTQENSITYARISENRDSYAISKLMSEFYIKLYSQKLNLEWLIFRIFNVYGPRMVNTKYGQVIPEFIQRLREKEWPLKIIGNGSQTRSFIYIDDHIELSYKAIQHAKKNSIYNLGNPLEVRIDELAMLIMNQMNIKPNLEYVDSRSGDHKRRCPDISKLINQIGQYDFITIEDGIKKMLSYN